MNKSFLIPFRIFFLMLLVLASVYADASAQNFDYIYLHGEYKIKAHLLEITPKKIRYTDENGNSQAKDGDDVLMIFNKAGDFMFFPQKELSALRIGEFLKATQFPKADFIVTLEKKMIAAHVITRNEHEVIYEDLAVPGKERALSSDLIAMILYKNGNHELLVSPSQSCAALIGVAGKIRLYNGTAYTDGEIPDTSPAEIKTGTHSSANSQNELNPPIEPQPKPIETIAPQTAKENVENNKKTEVSENKQISPKGKSTKVEVENKNEQPLAKKLTKEEQNNNNSKAIPVKMDSAGFLTPEGLQIFNKRALQKTRELAALLTRITEKNTTPELATQAVNDACNLFISDEARVEVSTGSETDYKVRYKIRDFLNKLNSMKDAQVSIAWTNVNFVSNLQKSVDGTYSGTITFKEKLSDLSGTSLSYSDQSRVNTEVLLKTVKGTTNDSWEVVLSDIGLVVVK